MFGLILILLGVLFLLKEMNIIPGDLWGYFWPIILIIVGLNLIKKDRCGIDCYSFFAKPKKKDQHKDHHKVVDEQ